MAARESPHDEDGPPQHPVESQGVYGVCGATGIEPTAGRTNAGNQLIAAYERDQDPRRRPATRRRAYVCRHLTSLPYVSPHGLAIRPTRRPAPGTLPLTHLRGQPPPHHSPLAPRLLSTPPVDVASPGSGGLPGRPFAQRQPSPCRCRDLHASSDGPPSTIHEPSDGRRRQLVRLPPREDAQRRARALSDWLAAAVGRPGPTTTLSVTIRRAPPNCTGAANLEEAEATGPERPGADPRDEDHDAPLRPCDVKPLSPAPLRLPDPQPQAGTGPDLWHRSHGHVPPALRPTAVDHRTAGLRTHPPAKSVLALALSVARLERLFHFDLLLGRPGRPSSLSRGRGRTGPSVRAISRGSGKPPTHGATTARRVGRVPPGYAEATTITASGHPTDTSDGCG